MTTTNAPVRLMEIRSYDNPMIDSDGDTYKVSSALNLLSCLLREDRTMPPDSAESFGLSVILDTCAAALRRMDEDRN